MTPQQEAEFRTKAKALGKSSAEIESFLRKFNSPKPTQGSGAPFTFKAQTNNNLAISPPIQPHTTNSNPFKVAGNIGVGAIKGIGSTLLNMGKTGVRALEGITGIKNSTDDRVTQNFENAVKPTDTAQKIGFYGEQVAEFFLPASKASNLSRGIDILADGAKFGGLAKAVGKGAVQAGAAATVRLGQTGDYKEAAKVGAGAGIITGVASGAGQALRAARIPEWFYSKVFHNTTDDVLQELKTVGTAAMQKSNPELYKKLVSDGVIRTQQGKVILNETLAKEALDRGLKGSIKNMANQVVKNTYELEATAQAIVKSYPTPIKIEPQYTRLLQRVSAEYRDVGFGEIKKETDDLLRVIQSGSTDAGNALKLRRFLDGMRLRFNPNAKLSTSQQNFKVLADNLRTRLGKEVPGLKSIMNEYRFSIDALEALAKEAKRRGNREAISFLDTVLFGSGIAAGNPVVGAGLGVTRRLVSSPRGTTAIGQGINKLGSKTTGKGLAAKGVVGILASKASQATQDNQ